MTEIGSATLLDHAGKPRFGHFSRPPDSVDPARFDYRTPMGRRRTALEKWWNFKAFRYFGVISPAIVAGVALVDVRKLAAAFVYVFLPETGELIERSFRAPAGVGASMTTSPRDGSSRFSQSGVSLEIANDFNAGVTSLAATLPDLEIEASFRSGPDDDRPLALCTRTGYDGWVYAQKSAGVRARGRISGRFGDVDLESAGAYAHHDFTAGFLRKETFWNWACLSGDAGGVDVGLNVSAGVNETGFSENCVWVDGELIPVGLARFEFDAGDPTSKWTVATGDGAVDLVFEPLGEHRERVNAVIVATRFRQIFGRFDGVLRPPGRDEIPIVGMLGFVEDQYAKW